MKKSAKVLLLLLLAISLFYSSQASGHLRRKGFGGYAFQPVTDSLAKSVEMKKTRGVEILQIMPDGTGAAAGIQVKDILLSVNGVEVNSFADFQNPKAQFRDGDAVTFVVWRKKKEKKLKTTALARPYETNENWAVFYEEVPFQGGYLRSIVTRPEKEGKLPAVLLIPGFTCSSLDNLPLWHPYRRVVDGLTERGYVVYRVEKPGMGDCDGTPDCINMDINTETDAFEAGLNQLKSFDFVDPDNIFLFGHSMGGIIAPLIAERNPVKGVMVYGTSHEPWYEYLYRMLRFQNPRMGVDYLENEQDMQLYHSLLYKWLIEKQSPKELVEENQAYAKILRRDFWWDGGEMLFGRHHSFQQSIQDLNMTKSWSKVDSYVLSIHGSSDIEVIDDFAHREIVRIVNHFHPEKASFLDLEDTDHSFALVGNMDAAFAARANYREVLMNRFNEELLVELDNWMKATINKS